MESRTLGELHHEESKLVDGNGITNTFVTYHIQTHSKNETSAENLTQIRDKPLFSYMGWGRISKLIDPEISNVLQIVSC